MRGTLAETLTFLDEDIVVRRGRARGQRGRRHEQTADRWVDEASKDVMFGKDAYVIRLFTGQVHHAIAEFTRGDVTQMVAQGPSRERPRSPPHAVRDTVRHTRHNGQR
jgi:hypothetical protein